MINAILPANAIFDETVKSNTKKNTETTSIKRKCHMARFMDCTAGQREKFHAWQATAWRARRTGEAHTSIEQPRPL